jgi:hypothetical protein
MRALPEQFRIAVYYADVEGLRSKEIASIMGTTLGTVMSRLYRRTTATAGSTCRLRQAGRPREPHETPSTRRVARTRMRMVARRRIGATATLLTNSLCG